MLAGAALSVTPEAVAAQNQAAAVENGNDDIIVTARRRDESLQETPIAITVFSAADLEARSAVDLADIDKGTPNLLFQTGADSAGTSNNAAVFIRGVGQNDFIPTTDPGVGIYVDGVYLGRSVGGVLGLLDLERVEVLRGPQGTLFGRNTIGGAISLTTAKPAFETKGKVAATFGNDDWYEGTASIEGGLTSKLAAKLSINYRNRGGYGTSSENNIDYGNENKLTLRAQLRWQASDDLTVDIAADYFRARQNSTPVVALLLPSASGFPPGVASGLYNGLVLTSSALNGPVTFGDPVGQPLLLSQAVDRNNPRQSSTAGPSRDNADTWGIGGTIEYDGWDWGRLKSITAYRQIDSFFASDNDGVRQNASATSESFKQWQFSQELQLAGETGRLKWLVGAYYFHEKATDFNEVRINPGTFAFLESLPAAIFPLGSDPCPPATGTFAACAGGAGNPLNRTLDNTLDVLTQVEVDNYAFFTQESYKLTDRLNATAGLRVSVERKRFTASQFKVETSAVTGTPFFSLPLSTEAKTFTSVTPYVGLDYTTAGGTLLYGSWSQGFRSGSFNGRATSQAVILPVDPETVDAFEIGFKANLPGNLGRFNAAVFYNDYRNIQIQAVILDPATLFRVELVNAASAHIYGAEAELALRPAPGVDLGATLAYTNAKISSIDADISALTGIRQGARLKRTPEWSFSLSGQYVHQLAAGNSLLFRADYNYTGEFFHEATNQAVARQSPYGLLDANVTYRSSHGYEISLFGTNLTDEVYYNSIFSSGDGVALGYPARGRQFGARLRYSF
ncbi:hypothetical protein IP88_04865 [alpha proteobacterium AAP81b]|nr:hypothetical protein IP88_04865 [alpha proteobacterium AAP81b]